METMIDTRAMTHAQVIAGTLEWVNTMRTEHNLVPLDKLPKGRRWDPVDCAIARALAPISDCSCPLPSPGRYGGSPELVGARWRYTMGGKVVERDAPPVVAEFIRRFDRGELS